MWNLLVKNKSYKLIEDYQLKSDDQLIISNKELSLVEVSSSKGLIDFTQLEIPNINIEKSMLNLFGRLFTFMPDGIEGHTSLLPHIFWPLEKLETRSVTFFGGSFNPWHEGHKECLRQCSKKEDLIVVVPDYSPWKDNSHEGPLANLCALAEKIDYRFPIYPGFWAISTNDQRNPTADWLGEVKISETNWLMGDDTFFNFLKWDRLEQVVSKLKKIYVVPRDHNVSELKEVEVKLLDMKPELEVIYLEGHPYQGLSSSKLR